MDKTRTVCGDTEHRTTIGLGMTAPRKMGILPVAKITLYKLVGYENVEEEVACAFLYRFEEGYNMVTVGRKDTCELRLKIMGKLVKTVSGEHCTIRVNSKDSDQPFITITDTSTNGTFINDEKEIGNGETVGFRSDDDFFLALGNNVDDRLINRPPRAFRLRCEIEQTGKEQGVNSLIPD